MRMMYAPETVIYENNAARVGQRKSGGLLRFELVRSKFLLLLSCIFKRSAVPTTSCVVTTMFISKMTNIFLSGFMRELKIIVSVAFILRL